jgi:hypothetical protein
MAGFIPFDNGEAPGGIAIDSLENQGEISWQERIFILPACNI